tara:strand:- start:14545 stop:14655 length:111 start_codon:yes stop_codon:yes gene_type:complete
MLGRKFVVVSVPVTTSVPWAYADPAQATAIQKAHID